MRLKKDIHIPAFIHTVNNCSGDVLFLTEKGDRLNLKSTLSQFIFATVIAGEKDLQEGTVEVLHPEDEEPLKPFFSDCD